MNHDSKLAVVSSCIKPSYVVDIKDLEVLLLRLELSCIKNDLFMTPGHSSVINAFKQIPNVTSETIAIKGFKSNLIVHVEKRYSKEKQDFEYELTQRVEKR